MSEPQRVLPVINDGVRREINLDQTVTREDVVAWVKFYNPRAGAIYVDTLTKHLMRAIRQARGEDDISSLETALYYAREYELDTADLEKSIRDHYRRRQAFHPES